MMARKNGNALGLALILMSSLLLGIWATKDTIALRNILLVLGALCAIAFLYQFFRTKSVKANGINWLPIICITLALLWVIAHYFFLSISPAVQLKELTSIWLRSALASIFGLATGIALIRQPRSIGIFWAAILISFLVLCAQYLPLAWQSQNIIVPLNVEDFRRYIYIGKINPMYMGVLLIAGSTGLLLDALNFGEKDWTRKACIFWLLCLFVAMYSFAFIINTRSGILLGSLVVFAWCLYGAFLVLRNRNHLTSLASSSASKAIFVLVIALVLIGIFAKHQIQRDSGWQQLVEDIQIGYQVEKYPHWQDVNQYGFPKTESGKVVTFNTYERMAWATAGIKSIPNHPYGVGVLLLPLGLAAKELFPGVTPISTHSGWVDLTLSFGLPMLGLLLVTNIAVLYFAMRQKSSLKYSMITLSITIFTLFLVGELSNGHSLEMVFYLYALIAGTQIAQKSNDVSST